MRLLRIKGLVVMRRERVPGRRGLGYAVYEYRGPQDAEFVVSPGAKLPRDELKNRFGVCACGREAVMMRLNAPVCERCHKAEEMLYSLRGVLAHRRPVWAKYAEVFGIRYSTAH